MKNILVTGASGFIGSFLIEEALQNGYKVYAAVRKSSSTKWLKQPEITLVYPDYSSLDSLISFFTEQKNNGISFDYIIHNAGVTKVAKRSDYFKVNQGLTEMLIDALEKSSCIPEKLVFMSSLAALGPGNAKTMKPIDLNQKPNPLTSYAKSKLAAEQFIESKINIPWVIIKPTTVYGPREQDLLVYYKMINKGIEGYIGLKEQHLSFIYVKDLVRLIIGLLPQKSIVHKRYIAADGCSYTNHELGELIRKNLNKKTFRFKIPILLAGIAAFGSEIWGRIIGRFPIFNFEKLAELGSVNWTCDNNPIQEELGFIPEYNLESGLDETLEWCKKNDWI